MDAHPSLMQPWQTRWKFGPTANLPIVELYYVSDLEPRWASMEAHSNSGIYQDGKRSRINYMMLNFV